MIICGGVFQSIVWENFQNTSVGFHSWSVVSDFVCGPQKGSFCPFSPKLLPGVASGFEGRRACRSPLSGPVCCPGVALEPLFPELEACVPTSGPPAPAPRFSALASGETGVAGGLVTPTSQPPVASGLRPAPRLPPPHSPGSFGPFALQKSPPNASLPKVKVKSSPLIEKLQVSTARRPWSLPLPRPRLSSHPSASLCHLES